MEKHRPTRMDEFIGQQQAKQALSVFIRSAQMRDTALDHVLLCGPPGLGKTTLANIIAAQQGGELHAEFAGAITTSNDLMGILEKINDNGKDVVFFDEIHRLPMKIEEMLYEVMEDFTVTAEVDVVYEGQVGCTTRKEIRRMWVPKFTLIGATTILGGISRPMRDRFGIQLELKSYSLQELFEMVMTKAPDFGVVLTPEGASEIAKRSRGTARLSVQFLRRARDVAFALTENRSITHAVACATFDILGIDEFGLKAIDYRYMECLRDRKPKGLKTIAFTIGEHDSTIEQSVEPYLMSLRLVERTPKGRILTDKGLSYLNNSSNNHALN